MQATSSQKPLQENSSATLILPVMKRRVFFHHLQHTAIALRKQIWQKKGSIAFTADNPFNKYVNRKTSVFGPGFTVNSLQRIPFRSFGINFTWKFGKLEFKKQKEDTQINLNAPAEQ